MGFWLQLGVSGFRMDAVPFVIQHEGRRAATHPEQYHMLQRPAELPPVAHRATPSCSPRPTSCPDEDLDYFGDEATGCT